MRQGAACLVGEHDFKSFSSARGQAKDTVRTIYSLDVDRTGDMITIRVSGSGFLYNMVRIIAGTLMKVGMGVYPPEHVAEILAARDRQQAGQTALARGLTLVSMEYEKELPCWHHVQVPEWSYHILQSHIPTEQTAFFWVEHCPDGEWHRLLNRNIHHAFQNGARRVFVKDLEGSRLKEGDTYGYYRLRQAPVCPERAAPAAALPAPSQPGDGDILSRVRSGLAAPDFTREEYAVIGTFDAFPGAGWFCAYDAAAENR